MRGESMIAGMEKKHVIDLTPKERRRCLVGGVILASLAGLSALDCRSRMVSTSGDIVGKCALFLPHFVRLSPYRFRSQTVRSSLLQPGYSFGAPR